MRTVATLRMLLCLAASMSVSEFTLGAHNYMQRSGIAILDVYSKPRLLWGMHET